jgi:hypothetical protein
MWGLFLAAMLGAWQVSRTRDRGVRIGPLAPAKPFNWLMIQIPRGWIVFVDEANAQLIGAEPPGGSLHRQLVITQQLLAGPPSNAFVAAQLHGAEQATSIHFAGLHANGVLAEGQFQDERTGAITQEYDAFVFLPDDNLAVTVEFRGVPGFAQIDRENFQAIIDHLQLARAAAPAQSLHHLPVPLSAIGRWRRPIISPLAPATPARLSH